MGNIARIPCLETEAFTAYIADNEALGIHRCGYNGVAALIPRATGNNLFVPSYSGLNYETISLSGMPAYRFEPRKEEHQSIFEPRCEPMSIESADAQRVVLVQPETGHARVGARITFCVEEPLYLHQRIELTFHRRFCASDEPSCFSSLWASYVHMPPDRHIYTKRDYPESSDDLEGWLGVTKANHRATEWEVRRLPDNNEISAREHLEAMKRQTPLSPNELGPALATDDALMALPEMLNGPLSFYYGFCHDSQLLLKMFKQPERFKLAYSPCGGGTEPAWSPAWDYVLRLDDAQIGETYTWDLCLAVKEYRNRGDILDEVRRYLRGSE